ncbi:glutathione-disulfide reductase [Gilvimarinus agarilyticus]|uniref:glutathione-disulfide reductase n=1 Tax=Gilvimarinus sp. 2_MG-2023 TaxID=3062666 RepID=UPI001C08558A|nr:glutathione-disulfide reductase [Gilvimarinus sp. 2_MG-2023]MBU2886435.1 glutathione-disulfide reductase [Gilvimarinus agarilyticus]MDO6571114.1 glutathione-disulfide reductase [Gilvimarinus sp. 2_MG-2023]
MGTTIATETYDLLVIGAGSGGVRASRVAASLGAKVAVIEERALGGTCVNVGCIPKKLFVYASQFNEQFERGKAYGWQANDIHFNWPILRDNTQQEIQRLNGVYGRILDNAGVTLLRGHARLLGDGQVQVEDTVYRAKRIILAVGGWPFIPDLPGREHAITSNEIFTLPELPERVVVVGGGYIACEFAGFLNGLGVDTHLIYRGDLILRGFDDDIRQLMLEQMRHKGVQVHLQTDIDAIEKTSTGQLNLALNNDSEMQAGAVIYATGRKPLLDNLGLENTQATTSKSGALTVGDDYQTAEPNLYAIGDAIDRLALTPVALAEGMDLAHRLYGKTGQGPGAVDYPLVPTAVFTQPNIATVGLTENQAQQNSVEYDVYRASFTPLPLTLSQSSEKVMVKLLVERASDKVIGCHMVGAEAGEIIQGLAVAMTAGATKADFDRTIGIHPTVAEEFVTLREPVTK